MRAGSFAQLGNEICGQPGGFGELLPVGPLQHLEGPIADIGIVAQCGLDGPVRVLRAAGRAGEQRLFEAGPDRPEAARTRSLTPASSGDQSLIS